MRTRQRQSERVVRVERASPLTLTFAFDVDVGTIIRRVFRTGTRSVLLLRVLHFLFLLLQLNRIIIVCTPPDLR